jgi:hypothetical protein
MTCPSAWALLSLRRRGPLAAPCSPLAFEPADQVNLELPLSKSPICTARAPRNRGHDAFHKAGTACDVPRHSLPRLRQYGLDPRAGLRTADAWAGCRATAICTRVLMIGPRGIEPKRILKSLER